jgi:aqualysin 1
MKKSLALLVALLATLALMPALAQQDPVGDGSLRSTAKFHRKGARAIPNQYIVVLDQDAVGKEGDVAVATRETDSLLASFGRKADQVFAHAINGFSVQMTEQEALALSEDPRVAFVEEDQIMEAFITQTNPPWGLDRIGQRDLPLNATYSYTTTGAGVHAYIIDTGLRSTHTQFTGRVGNAAGFVNDGQGTNDCHGHGTHVAGTVGGTTYGVAKQVTLHAVRVLSCSGSGSNSGVISGVNWVTANRINPAVANMSLGGGISTALDTAVNNSINSGVTYAIAAGNSNTNAANSSPARVAAAITVGSSTSSDARSSFSNFGSVVDSFAQGSGILSAWRNSNTWRASPRGLSRAILARRPQRSGMRSSTPRR